MQNKALDKSTKFAYIVLDDKRISKTQSKYFESNNIGVVNLHNMPLINDIPHDLTNEIGKRLYSFLRIIDDASLERYLGKLVSYDEAVNAIGKYKYVNSQNICNLLYLGTYSTTGNELTIFSEANYDSLVNYFNIKSENALALKQHFINAGIRNIRLISTSTTRRNEKYDIEDTFHNTILDNKLFVAYINNNYIGLIIQLNSETIEGVFESAFYTTLVKDYISQVFEWYDDMKEVELTIEQKIRYLFNKATLESKKTYNRFDASSLERYIDGIPDVNQKKLYQSYKDILSGNYQKLFDIEKALEKLKEQYNNENYSFIGCSSLQELYKIKKVAIDQYLFYFNNTLFFKGFSDLKKILKVYIEAIICTNGQFQEITSTKWGGVSKKDRYEIDAIDFDIITKFISIKDLYNLLKENPDLDLTPQTFIFGAKAAPGYYHAKEIIELINKISEDINSNPVMKKKLNVVFIEDYCVSLAEKLMPASEISEQISLAGKEASGTGNMKFMINGAVTFGTMDGANVEIYDSVGNDNIFIFGMTATEVNDLWRKGYNSTYYYNNSRDLHNVIERLRKGFAGKSFENIANYLLTNRGIADQYMCLADFNSYMETYWKMDEIYRDKERFNRMSLINISEAGRFAADRAIKEYAEDIWNITKVE